MSAGAIDPRAPALRGGAIAGGPALRGGAAIRGLPGRRLALLSLAALPLYAFADWGLAAGLLYNAILVVAAIHEARTLAARVPSASRKLDARLLVGVENEVVIRLHNASAHALRVTVRDDLPDSFTEDRAELATVLPPHARTELSYKVLPARRGRFRFGQVHVRIEGLLSLGAVVASIDAEQRCRVYPNLRGPKRYELAMLVGALHSVGVRALRRPGGGGEFEQLREYVSGDSFRDLDWKATAKRRRPVTRVNGQEQSQTVIVAIDAGRMMATALDQLTKLDHAINAALLVAYVALRSGDRVGLLVFAENVHTFVPPLRGHTQYRRILEALAGVEASPTYVDFRRLSEFVRARVPRRALLVIFSDLLDESQATPMAEQAALLKRKHLPVCVTMNDPLAESLAHAEVHSSQQAYRRAAAAAVLEERDAIKAQLRKSGVSLVEAPASALAIETVNRYLEIKSRHAL
jgi:uncharacterized protein (DUF58 family)